MGDAVALAEISADTDGIERIFPKQLLDGRALLMAEFEDQPPTGAQRGEALGDETADVVEAVVAGKKGLRGLEIANLWREVVALVVGNIGRVADDDIEGDTVVGECVEEVALSKVNAVIDVVSGGVASCDVEGVGVDIGGPQLEVGVFGGEDDGDDAAAGADIGDADGGVVKFGDSIQGLLDENFSIGPGVKTLASTWKSRLQNSRWPQIWETGSRAARRLTRER